MADPGGAGQGLVALLGELAAFGLAIGFSPLHIGLLLLPLLALVLAGPERVLTLLERGKQGLFANGNLLVGLVGVALRVYLGCQGIEGLRLG